MRWLENFPPSTEEEVTSLLAMSFCFVSFAKSSGSILEGPTAFLGTSLKAVELARNHQWCSLPLVQAPSPQGHLGWLQWLGADVWWLRFISVSFQRFEEISNIPLEHTPDPTIYTSL